MIKVNTKSMYYRMEDDDDAPSSILDKLSEERLFNKKFLEERKIFLWGAVHDDSARHIVNRLMYLDQQKPGEEIKLYINSPGGVVTSGLVIMDTMQMISSPVSTIVMGMAASMGAMLLSAGEKGRRFAYPHAQVMIHQPALGGQITGQAADLEVHAEQISKTKRLSAQILADNCGQSFDKIMKDFDRDYWLDADAGIEYGILDGKIDKL